MELLTFADEEFLLTALASGEMFADGSRGKTALKLCGLGMVHQSFASPSRFWLTSKGVALARAVDQERRQMAYHHLVGGMEVRT